MNDARIPGTAQRPVVEFSFAGKPVQALAGDTLAMALWAAQQQTLRNSSSYGAPRGVLCNMGICYECLLVVDGKVVRGCMTIVRDGMVVQRGGKP